MTRAAIDLPGQVNNALEVDYENKQTMNSEAISISSYEQEIPAFLVRELESLYENMFALYTKFSALKNPVNASAYVVRESGKITTVLLFRKEGNRLHILNEFIRIENEELHRFAHYAFSKYPGVAVISFRAIQSDVRQLPFPLQRQNCIEDIELALPRSASEYEGKLSKKLKSNIRTYLNRIKRDHPSFSFEIFEKEAADEQYIRNIIQFNQARMAGKSKTTGTSEEEIRRIVEMAKAYGLIAVIKIDGKVCAGRILFRIGSKYFSLLNAHSPEFNEYRLGTLCNYLAICECIARGGRTLNFLWGREGFKYRFLGEQRDFDEVVVYRSRLHMAINCRLAMKTVLKGLSRQAKLWLLDPKRQDHFAVKSAKRSIRYLRGLRH